jgi:hypothetical protein
VAVQVLRRIASAGSVQRVSEVAAGRHDLDRRLEHLRNTRDGYRPAHAGPRRDRDRRAAQVDDQDAPASTPGTLGALLMRYPSQTCVRLAPQRRNSLTGTLVRNWQTIAFQAAAG